MKTLNEYFMQIKKSYPFKVKIAGDFTTEQELKLKSLLEKYQVKEFKKSTKTPVQSLPLDFPKLSNVEVNIFEVTLDYPVAAFELQYYLGNGLQINEQQIVVRYPHEPYERYQEETPERTGALLNDSNYNEAPNANFDEFYGDKYNASFVKALSDDLKAKRDQRGEKIPTEGRGQTTNDLPQGTRSPIKQTDYDPRKK